MPYINKESREEVLAIGAVDAGELNFEITKVCLAYFHMTDRRYKDINEVIGALECAKQEFYRRVAVPYEDQKIKENGDVY